MVGSSGPGPFMPFPERTSDGNRQDDEQYTHFAWATSCQTGEGGAGTPTTSLMSRGVPSRSSPLSIVVRRFIRIILRLHSRTGPSVGRRHQPHLTGQSTRGRRCAYRAAAQTHAAARVGLCASLARWAAGGLLGVVQVHCRSGCTLYGWAAAGQVCKTDVAAGPVRPFR